jgi:hypothetical protein
LREIFGFRNCTSLCRIEIPSSVEVIGEYGFKSCQLLRVVIFPTGCRIRMHGGLKRIKTFLVYEQEDMKRRRRLLHHVIG